MIQPFHVPNYFQRVKSQCCGSPSLPLPPVIEIIKIIKVIALTDLKVDDSRVSVSSPTTGSLPDNAHDPYLLLWHLEEGG